MIDTEQTEPTAIVWSNLHRWANRTLRTSRRRSRVRKPLPSAGQLWRMAIPNLRRPIFVIGAPRSGTTFLGDSLGVLPELSYHFEPVATKAAARYVYEQLWDFRTARWFYRQVYGWLMRIYAEGQLRFAEKTPRNCFIMPFLDRAFPEAQFIHIVRDGRDVAVSWSEKPWLRATSVDTGRREPGGYLYGPYPRFWVESDRTEEFVQTSDFHRCIWGWRLYTEAARRAGAALSEAQYLELRYENLVNQPQAQAERLLGFLGIENPVSRERLSSALGDADPRSVGRWRRDATKEKLEILEREAGELLEVLSYS